MEEIGSTELGHSVQPWGLVCQGRRIELHGSGRRCEGILTRGTYMEIDRDKKTGRNTRDCGVFVQNLGLCCTRYGTGWGSQERLLGF